MFTTLHTASFENVPYDIEYQKSTMGVVIKCKLLPCLLMITGVCYSITMSM